MAVDRLNGGGIYCRRLLTGESLTVTAESIDKAVIASDSPVIALRESGVTSAHILEVVGSRMR